MNDSFSYNIMGMDCKVYYNVTAKSKTQKEYEPAHGCEVEIDYIETDRGFNLTEHELHDYYIMADVYEHPKGTVRKPVPIIIELTHLAGEDASGKGY